MKINQHEDNKSFKAWLQSLIYFIFFLGGLKSNCDIGTILHATNDTSLEHKSYIRYLGMLIDENLSWKHHILHIASKISSSIIGIIARLRHFVPLHT